MENYNIYNKNILIVGLGKSGVACARLCVSQSANVFVFDKDKAKYDLVRSHKLFEGKNIVAMTKIAPKYLKDMDIVVLSPSIQLSARIEKYLKEQHIALVGEIEFSSRFCRSEILAITGTNGKTTTTTLLGEIVQAFNPNTYVLGNIGKAFATKALSTKRDGYVVLEVSSFQLKTIATFTPKIAALLNLKEDHMDYHKTFEDYASSKLRIFENMKASDFAVVNYNDAMCVERTKNIVPEIYYFSTTCEVKGAYLKDGAIYFCDGTSTFSICEQNDIRLVGMHNIANVLCAVCMAFLIGISKELIKDTIINFKGLTHRIEFVKTKNSVSYYNDSKATNVDSTLVATRSFSQNIVLLLGGSYKGENFKALFRELPQNVRYVVAYGKTANKIMRAARALGYTNISKCDGLLNAVLSARIVANEGDVVLLSPACASFDQFRNYEERGDSFKEIVRNLE